MATPFAKFTSSKIGLHSCLKSLINGQNVIQRRTLLSPAFSCDKEWRARLTEPMLSRVNTDVLMSQLFNQFEKNGAATAVDMEVFSNKVQDVHPTQLHLIETLLKRFRRCSEGVSVIDSMSHNIIRCYLQLNQADRLIPMIQDKMDYGLFPDDVAFCLLLDHFIKAGDLKSATKVAIEMMLQDDMNHPSAKLLALYACSKYLDESRDRLLASFNEDDKPVLDEEEDEYVVVKFIPLHNFDDHFDITDEKRLIGRTLDFISRHESNSVYKSYLLIGLAMHEDFNKLLGILEDHLEDTSIPFYREVLDILEQCVYACKSKTETIVREAGSALREDSEYNARHTVEEREEFIAKYQELRTRLDTSPLLDSNLLEDAQRIVTESLEANLLGDTDTYKAMLERWSNQRSSNIELQERAFQLKERQEAFDAKIRELTEKEELLNYFVRQNEVSLALLRAGNLVEADGEVDLTEYVAEPGKRGKKGKLGM